jgi:hypothetical protein
LRSAYRARHSCPDLDRVTAFRTRELRPGWVPSIPRGRRCSSRTEWRAQPAPAASQRPALDPAPTSHLARMHFTRHQRGFKQFTRPAIPLACDRPDGTGRHLGFPPSFAPRRPGADNARRGGDRPSSTDLKLLAQHHIGLILQSCSSLTACDFASQRQRCASPCPRRSAVVIGHTACLLCRDCESHRCACRQPDPPHLASAPGSRSRRRAAILVNADRAPGLDGGCFAKGVLSALLNTISACRRISLKAGGSRGFCCRRT